MVEGVEIPAEKKAEVVVAAAVVVVQLEQYWKEASNVQRTQLEMMHKT